MGSVGADPTPSDFQSDAITVSANFPRDRCRNMKTICRFKIIKNNLHTIANLRCVSATHLISPYDSGNAGNNNVKKSYKS